MVVLIPLSVVEFLLILAYQRGVANAFYDVIFYNTITIEEAYLSGVSLTHDQQDQDNIFGVLLELIMNKIPTA